MSEKKGFFKTLIQTTFRKWNLQDGQHHPEEFLGKVIWAAPDLGEPLEQVVVKEVRGCMALGDLPEVVRNRLIKSFEINGTHLVTINSFYTQLLENRLPTEEEEAEFDLATQITKISELKGNENAE